MPINFSFVKAYQNSIDPEVPKLTVIMAFSFTVPCYTNATGGWASHQNSRKISWESCNLSQTKMVAPKIATKATGDIPWHSCEFTTGLRELQHIPWKPLWLIISVIPIYYKLLVFSSFYTCLITGVLNILVHSLFRARNTDSSLPPRVMSVYQWLSGLSSRHDQDYTCLASDSLQAAIPPYHTSCPLQ